jgi:hypothetical protein
LIMPGYTTQQIRDHLIAMKYLSPQLVILNPMGIYQEAVKYNVSSGELGAALVMGGAEIRNWIMSMNLAPLPADVALGVPYIRPAVTVTTVSPAPAPSPSPSPAPAPAPSPGTVIPGTTYVPTGTGTVYPTTLPTPAGDTSTKQILLWGGVGLAALLLLRRSGS